MTKDDINKEYVELCKTRGHLELSIELSRIQIENVNRRVAELRRLNDELDRNTPSRNESSNEEENK